MEKSSFLMPFGEQGVTVVAVLKDRYETINAVAMFGTMYGGSFDDLVTVSYHVNSGGELFNNSLSANIQKGDIVTVDSILLNNDNYSFDCLKIVKITEKGEEIVLNTNEVPVEFCLDEWLSYRICCVLSLNSGSQSQGKPLLSDGVAKRTGENTAIVSFTSDTEGRYYYGICDPPYRIFVSTNSDQNGYYAAAGVNVINIDSLSSGAKVICILLKTSEGVLSDLYAIDIPAYKDEHVENELYSVNINVPPGGNVFCDKHTAKAGEVVYISVVPDDGYRLVEGSLVYTQSISGIESTVIFGYSFAMPHCDVVVSCQWEKIAEYQPDSASQYWDDIVNVSNQKPWWIYANELANKGDYPKYW